MPKKKITISATELAQYEYCPKSWWYEQTHPLADLSAEELREHIAGLEKKHGEDVWRQVEFQVAENLLMRKQDFENGFEEHAEHADKVTDLERQATPPRSLAILILLAIIVLLAILVIGVIHWLH